MGREFHKAGRQWKKEYFISVTPRERNSEGGEISTVVNLEQRVVNNSVIIENLITKTKTQPFSS